MDSLTTIVSAIVLGAAAGMKPTAEQAVKDAYSGLKQLISSRFSAVSLSSIERDPDSENRRAVLAEDLSDANAQADGELLERAETFIRIIERDAPEVIEAVGIDIERLRGRNIELRDITATGSGIKGKDWEASGDIVIERVNAGNRGADPGKR